MKLKKEEIVALTIALSLFTAACSNIYIDDLKKTLVKSEYDENKNVQERIQKEIEMRYSDIFTSRVEIYETVYNYFIDTYGIERAEENQEEIQKIINENYYDSNTFWNACANSIISLQTYNDYAGNIDLAIIQELLPESDLVFELLTNPELDIANEIKEKYEIGNYEYEKLIENLCIISDAKNLNEEQNKVSFVKEALYKDSNEKKEIIKNCFHAIESANYNESFCIPNWSILANDESGYSVLYTNEYVDNYDLILEAQEKTNMNDILEKRVNEKGFEHLRKDLESHDFDDSVGYLGVEIEKDQTLRLIRFLNKDQTIKKDEETNEEYLERVQEYFLENYDINMYQLSLGLEQNNIKAYKKYFQVFFKNLAYKNIDVEDIYNFNFFLKYYKEKNHQFFDHKKENHEHYELHESIIEQMQMIVASSKKDVLLRLINCDGACYWYLNPLNNKVKEEPDIHIVPDFTYENYDYRLYGFPKEIDPRRIYIHIDNKEMMTGASIGIKREEKDGYIIYIVPKTIQVNDVRFWTTLEEYLTLFIERSTEETMILNRK